MRRLSKIPVLVTAVLCIGTSSLLAAGIDSRPYTCADLHRLIAAQGFVFINNPGIGDFVVSGPNYCGGSERVTLRSVQTSDRPECPVNYCESKPDPAPQ